MYVIISADILAGHEGAPGLVCDLLGTRPSGWCGSRQLLAAIVAVCFMAPLITPKRLASTAITSWIGLVSELWAAWLALQLGCSLLCCCAVEQGRSKGSVHSRPVWLTALAHVRPFPSSQVAVGTWAVVTLGLAVAAAVQGRAIMPRLLPDFEAFSGGAAQVGGAGPLHHKAARRSEPRAAATCMPIHSRAFDLRGLGCDMRSQTASLPPKQKCPAL